MASVADLLGGAGIDAREARLLLSVASGMATALIAAFPEREIAPAAAREFQEMAGRRLSGEPVAYILGYREFYSRQFKVTPDVLIPRPETEQLVDLALEYLPAGASVEVLDLGTGSGIVAITLACEAGNARVTAIDASAAALAVARENAAHLASPESVHFMQSDWFTALNGRRFGLIVGNPPYIAQGDTHLAQGDLRFEPAAALASGPAGLDAIRQITAEAPRHLAAGAWLLLEHGYDQGPACRDLLAASGLMEVQTWRDLAGLERISGGRAAH